MCHSGFFGWLALFGKGISSVEHTVVRSKVVIYPIFIFNIINQVPIFLSNDIFYRQGFLLVTTGWPTGLNGLHVAFYSPKCCGFKPHMCDPQIGVLSMSVLFVRFVLVC